MEALDSMKPDTGIFTGGFSGPSKDVGRLLFAAGGNGSGDGAGGTPCPGPIELILYVGCHSENAAQAVRNIRGVLSRFKASSVKLTVCDTITFTPTLVRKAPGPRTFILGHISSPELVLELLADCEEGG
jgi:hypothetical protein